MSSASRDAGRQRIDVASETRLAAPSRDKSHAATSSETEEVQAESRGGKNGLATTWRRDFKQENIRNRFMIRIALIVLAALCGTVSAQEGSFYKNPRGLFSTRPGETKSLQMIQRSHLEHGITYLR